jgi:signal transduction histidine kinase/FixJ family two-component response regulator/HPt (histidine-containing phosphotransfer) domain-containing protein
MNELEDLLKIIERERVARMQTEKILAATNKRLSESIAQMTAIQQALLEQKAESSRIIEKAKKDAFMANLKLSSLIRNLPTGVILEDVDHKVLHVNAQFCQLFDLLTPCEMLEGVYTSDIFELVKDSYQQPELFKEETSRLYRQGVDDNTIALTLSGGRILECCYVPITADDEMAGHLWQFKDITASKQAKDELLKAKEQAEESARAKENFLANISHEMRTPMNGILGIADLLAKTDLGEEQQNYLQLIKASGQNLLVIINDILDAAKIKSGKLHLEKIPFNIVDAVTSAYNALIYKAEEKNLEFTLEPFYIEHPYVEGDPYRLNQVLLNLLNNALKFTTEGEVALGLTALDETETSLTLEFMVKDSGIGIAQENLEIIFEGFTQVHSGSDRKFGGTGLGLSICKTLVQQMGGDIWAESTMNQGSTFRFVLTFAKAEKPVEEPVEILDFKSLGNVQILLAEDNEVNLFLTQSLMENWGFTVDTAVNGQEAVTLASQKVYDVILMDIQMPELNGIDATRLIRNLADHQKANVPIIALTANAFPEDYKHYLSNGMNDYLSKPYKENALFRKIAANLPAEAPQEPKKAAPEELSLPGEKLYDLSHLHSMCRGNEAFFNKMLKVFIDTVPTSVVSLETAMLRQDWTNVAEMAHKLKTSFDTMRVSSLKPVIRKLEVDAKKQENLAAIPEQVEKVTQTTRALLDQLRLEVK